jgi:lysophospholipase L1-like esterase
MVHLCRDFGIEPVLMTEPLAGATNDLTPKWAELGAQDRFNAIVRQVGKQEQVAVIDLARHLQQEVPDWDKPGHVFYDAIHVNDDGSEVYARHIAERLAPLIRAALDRPQGKEKSQ